MSSVIFQHDVESLKDLVALRTSYLADSMAENAQLQLKCQDLELQLEHAHLLNKELTCRTSHVKGSRESPHVIPEVEFNAALAQDPTATQQYPFQPAVDAHGNPYEDNIMKRSSTFPLALNTPNGSVIVCFPLSSLSPSDFLSHLVSELNSILNEIKNNDVTTLAVLPFRNKDKNILSPSIPFLTQPAILHYREHQRIPNVTLEIPPQIQPHARKEENTKKSEQPTSPPPRPPRSHEITSQNIKGDSKEKEVKQVCIKGLLSHKVKMIPVVVIIEEKAHNFTFPITATITSIKHMILQQQEPKLEEQQIRLQTFSFLLKITGTGFYLPEDKTTLGDLHIINILEKKGLVPIFTLISKEKSYEDKTIGRQIINILQSDTHFTRDLHWKEIKDTDETDFRIKMSRLLGDTPYPYFPFVLAELSVPGDGFPETFTIVVSEPLDDVKGEHFATTMRVSHKSTANEILPALCKKMDKASVKEMERHPKQHSLKIAGEDSYIHPNTPMSHLVYVQSRIRTKQKVIFVLTEKKIEPSKRLGKARIKTLKTNRPFLQSTVNTFGTRETTSILELKSPFEFRVTSVTNLGPTLKKVEGNATSFNFFITSKIYFGGEAIPKGSSSLKTSLLPVNSCGTAIYWKQWLRSSIRLCDLPEDSRLCITLWAKATNAVSKLAIANVNCSLFDFKDHFRTGKVSFRMWVGAEANPIGTCMENLRSDAIGSVPVLELDFHSFPLNVVFPSIPKLSLFDYEMPQPTAAEKMKIEFLVARDPLYQLDSAEEKPLIWKYREWIRKHISGRSIVTILQCVEWYNLSLVREAYRLLDLWIPIPPDDALQLLDAKFGNRKVREFAVFCLDTLPDNKLKDYLLQLVQALKYEPNHFSPLATWLVCRCLGSPMILGIAFFWMLKAELHMPEISERYSLLLETYLRSCGAQRDDLHRQTKAISALHEIAVSVKSFPHSRRKQELQQRLKNIKLPPSFQLPLDPKRRAKGLIIEKCKTMDSAKAPLWLVFENEDPLGDPIWLIYKSGDDLRQDLLTLQMLGLMDKMWKNESLDLCLTPYKCISTGEDMGMIETVLHSTTTAAIQKAAGGVTGPLKLTPLLNWLKKHNPGTAYDTAVWNFTRSCAGYCIATYVLGIGDRHNDNIMVNQQGFLFHIDFGHFLGHYKTIVLNVRRERAPFVLTPEFANVMGSQGSDNFKQFVKLCCEGYNIIRKHANVFINLFAMMLSTGIPELQSEMDIEYIQKALQMDKTDEEAALHFTKLIKESLESMSTQLMFVTHIMAHWYS